MVKHAPAEPSATIRERVEKARGVQQARLKESGFFCNAEIPAHAVRVHCPLDDSALRLLASACAQRHFSARALDRIARVSRTIADLADCADIRTEHVAEAIQYRSLERLDSRAA